MIKNWLNSATAYTNVQFYPEVHVDMLAKQ